MLVVAVIAVALLAALQAAGAPPGGDSTVKTVIAADSLGTT